MQITIYGLIDPRTSQLRYVGQTTRNPRTRLAAHLQTARKNTSSYVGAWARGVLDAGFAPDMVVIEVHAHQEGANEAECFWIEYFRAVGCRLVNRAIGGEVRTGWRHTAAQRAKWARERTGQKAPRYGDPKSPEERAAISAGMKRRWQIQPHPRLGKAHTEETKAKIRAHRALNPPKVSEAGRASQAEALRRRWQDPEWRARFTDKVSGENNPRHGKPMLPHVRAALEANRRRGHRHKPETIEKMRAAALEREARRRAAKKDTKPA